MSYDIPHDLTISVTLQSCDIDSHFSFSTALTSIDCTPSSPNTASYNAWREREREREREKER